MYPNKGYSEGGRCEDNDAGSVSEPANPHPLSLVMDSPRVNSFLTQQNDSPSYCNSNLEFSAAKTQVPWQIFLPFLRQPPRGTFSLSLIYFPSFVFSIFCIVMLDCLEKL